MFAINILSSVIGLAVLARSVQGRTFHWNTRTFIFCSGVISSVFLAISIYDVRQKWYDEILLRLYLLFFQIAFSVFFWIAMMFLKRIREYNSLPRIWNRVAFVVLNPYFCGVVIFFTNIFNVYLLVKKCVTVYEPGWNKHINLGRVVDNAECVPSIILSAQLLFCFACFIKLYRAQTMMAQTTRRVIQQLAIISCVIAATTCTQVFTLLTDYFQWRRGESMALLFAPIFVRDIYSTIRGVAILCVLGVQLPDEGTKGGGRSVTRYEVSSIKSSSSIGSKV